MTLTELFDALNARGLTLARKGDAQVVVSGDMATLTPDLKTALAEHKLTLLTALPKPEAVAARPEPKWWWNRELSHYDNATLDSFMGYGPAGPKGDVQDLYLTDGCEGCGSIVGWSDLLGDHHCLGCDPVTPHPAPGIAIILREKAAARQADPSIPMHGPKRRRR